MPDQALDESLLTPSEDGPPTSPFLPGTNIQYAWDSTSLGLLKTCPRLYQYTMIDGWGSKHESIHLRFGQEYHSALEAYDRSRAVGVNHNDAVHDTIRALLERIQDFHPDPESKAGKYKSRHNLLALVIDYLDHFENDPAKTHIKSNGDPAVELSFRFELDFGPLSGNQDKPPDQNQPPAPSPDAQPYLLCGHLDRVVEYNDQLLVMDRKTTTSTLSSNYFKSYEPSNQMTLYTIAGQVILGGPIKGVVIDAAQILLEQPNRFVRGFTYRTEDQLSEWLLDLEILLRSAETYAEANYWPQNDTACDKFGGCRFRDVCSKSPQVREMFLKTDFTKQEIEDRWNPLKSR